MGFSWQVTCIGRNDWDHNVKGDEVEGPVNLVNREEVAQVLNEMKNWKAPIH